MSAPRETLGSLRDEWEAHWPRIMGDAQATEEFVERLFAAEPSLPREPSEAAIKAAGNRWRDGHTIPAILRAAYAVDGVSGLLDVEPEKK